jgi:hypothetical protein
VKESDLEVGRLFPPLQDIRSVSFEIAKAICEDAYQNGKILALRCKERMEEAGGRVRMQNLAV